MTSETKKIGVFLPDADFEHFRRATIGKEDRFLWAIVKLTIMEGDKLGNKRKSHTKDIVCKKDDLVANLYDRINDDIGNESRKRLNERFSQQLSNGYGDINAQLKEVDKKFEEWKEKNSEKYNL